LIEDLSSLDVVVLGHYDLPEQTPASSAREQFGEAAQATLDEVAASFADAGASVRTRLVFGKDRAAAIRQVAVEEGCAAELDPAPTEGIARILVPLPDVAEFDRLPTFIRVLSEDSTQRITLFHVVEGEERRERGEAMVSETRERLIEDGFAADAVDTLVVEGDEHDEEILRVAADYDAVVMYEPESSLGDRVFGTLPDRIADETGDPVIVVDRDY
jgi:nucleotide-binding universal stress UspA family protein